MRFAVLFVYIFLPAAFAPRVWYKHNFKIPKKTRGTGRTSTRKPDATTRALFYFEGVDYDAMPENLKTKNNDCYAHFVWCIQNQTLMNSVCGWNYDSYRLDDYYSPCEIEVQNCRWRTARKNKKYRKPQKGDDMRNDLIYYNGEGYDCKYYARMGGDAVENYFSSGRRMMYYKEFIKDHVPYQVTN